MHKEGEEGSFTCHQNLNAPDVTHDDMEVESELVSVVLGSVLCPCLNHGSLSVVLLANPPLESSSRKTKQEKTWK